MINWIEKKHKGRSRGGYEHEVVITVIKNGKQANGKVNHAVTIRFYHSAETRITKGERLKIGIDEEKGRVYFDSAEETEGYKLSCRTSRGKTKVVQFSPDDILEWTSLTGGYDLLHDKENDLYFIDISKKRIAK